MSGPAAGKWNDLTVRLVSALAMAVVGIICVWQGGWPFRLLTTVVAGLMMWELVRMRAPDRRSMAIAVAVLSALSVVLFPHVGWIGQVALVLAPALAAGLACVPHWKIGAAYALLIVIGSDTLVAVRDALGFGWLVWLVLVVIATDVAGYFAGKAFGGPKFWPAISPKKTWSGTIAGWFGAAGVGWVFGLGSGAMAALIALSVALSFAGQMGDIVESAIKRRSGVKDSSALIPGHGGVLDRFDALLGASVVLLAIAWATGFPAGLL